MFNYFNPKEKIIVIGDFINGKYFLNNFILDKNEKKKIVIFENSLENKVIITLEPNEDIKKVKENLKNKTIKEMINDKDLRGK